MVLTSVLIGFRTVYGQIIKVIKIMKIKIMKMTLKRHIKIKENQRKTRKTPDWPSRPRRTLGVCTTGVRRESLQRLSLSYHIS